MTKRTKITASERDKIAVLLAQKHSLRSISRQLNRSVSSISDEIKRNSIAGVYTAITAHQLGQRRNTKSRRLNPLKNPSIYSYVVDKLRCGWSPEQIAGRLRKQNKGKTVICHETIYRYIYSSSGRQKKLHEYLTKHHYKRRRWYGRYQYRRGISNRVSIRLRPEEINNKTTFGHWEADVVEGKAHQGGIQTFLERKTRFYQARLLVNIDSEYGFKAQKDMLISVPKVARKSVTFDNGKENYNHYKLVRDLGVKTYFCDPNCAWQKGSNEYHNGILRRYIPKKTDITTLSQFELNTIVEEINNQPKKCLGYQTPKEAFKKELQLAKCSDSD